MHEYIPLPKEPIKLILCRELELKFYMHLSRDFEAEHQKMQNLYPDFVDIREQLTKQK